MNAQVQELRFIGSYPAPPELDPAGEVDYILSMLDVRTSRATRSPVRFSTPRKHQGRSRL